MSHDPSAFPKSGYTVLKTERADARKYYGRLTILMDFFRKVKRKREILLWKIPKIPANPTEKGGLYSCREKCYNTLTYRKEADAAWKPR
jgi:hypothetical protein